MTSFKYGEPAIAHALVSVTSSALACFPAAPKAPLRRRRRVAARVRQARRGVRPERHAVAVARGEALLEARVPERSRAARAFVASEVQTRAKLACGLIATRIPAKTSRA